MWYWRSHWSVGESSSEVNVTGGVEQTFREEYKGGTVVVWLVAFDDVSLPNAKVNLLNPTGYVTQKQV